MSKIFRIAAAVFVAALLAGPLAAPFAADPSFAQSGQPMLLPVHPEPLMSDEGAARFSVEIADDDAERSAGLMYRRVMPDDRGMLFVFENTRRVAFWMKNTPLPLDLIFVDEEGTVIDIKPGVPFSEAAIASPSPVRFVLELKAGTAQKTGIVAGDRLRHPVIDSISGAD